ncbi:MAG: vanadium-dependent haloperoxidase [Rhizobiaceae bacterium]
MSFVRRTRALALALVILVAGLNATFAGAERPQAQEVLQRWYALSLELVRHTPTYTPPVASRALAYMGVAAYEATASGSTELVSLAGQLNQLQPLPKREANLPYDEAVIMQAALSTLAQSLFENTGPTGQRVLKKLDEKLGEDVRRDLGPDVAQRSLEHGRAIAAHILEWSKTDGGAVIENLGFPTSHKPSETPGTWVPTNKVALQQAPLLPNWGKNRPFAMPSGATCQLKGPPAYSEDPASEFYKQAIEVVEAKKALTPEQKAIARFWADDAMLSPTPPGHWISIALQIIERDKLDMTKSVDVLARLGIGMADAFIGCWNGKFEYNLLRPLTYIRKVIDPKWDSLINTPPFPEYPSGHSTQSGAAALVMTQMFGENFAFEDATHAKDNIKPRSFPSFEAAAQEAGISRLYGGIHYRAAIEHGIEQGRCIGAYANALKTRN